MSDRAWNRDSKSELPETAWGHPKRHYAAWIDEAQAAKRQPEEADAGPWEEALALASPGIRESVLRTYKQWNTILRDYLRNEMALRLSVGNDMRSVPVRIVGGMPVPFAEVMREFRGLEWLLLNRPAIAATSAGTLFMAQQVDAVRRIWGDKAGSSTQDELIRVHKTADVWLEALDKVEAVDKIVGINEDVLGAYFFRVPEIRLYWVVIGITARALGVSAEALTIVVLAHELAHAYTHLGRDIDSQRWDTERFAATELDIVEGLAQFYTSVLCRRLDQRMPAALKAYEVLLEKQSGPYRAHEAWVEDHAQAGEIVRVSMIECRSQGITKGDKFVAAIKKYREGIRGQPKQAGAAEATNQGDEDGD